MSLAFLSLLALVAPVLAAPSAVYLSKSTFTVQTKDTVEYVYVVGEGGMRTGDAIRVEDPLFHGMTWVKWGNPRLAASDCSPLATDQDSSKSLVTAATTGDATVSLSRVDETGRAFTGTDLHVNVMSQVIVESGALVEGDEIVLTYGDTSTNDLCGHEFPDRAFREVAWRTYESLGDATDFTEVSPAPTFDVLADPEVTTLYVTAPSLVQTGETFALKVAPLDYLGNAVQTWTGTVRVETPDGGEVTHTFVPTDEGHWDTSLSIDAEGVYRVEVTASGLSGTSNPIKATAEAPTRRIWWMDNHNHYGHTYWTDEGERVDENHVYARDVVNADITCESTKAIPTSIDYDDLWEELKENCTGYTEVDSYLVLLGFEWVGNLPASDFYHHNVYYDACDAPLGNHDEVVELDGDDGFYAWVRAAQDAYGVRALVLPHAPCATGYDWEKQDPDLRRLVEVYSEWGDNMDPPETAGQDCSVPSALKAGNKMGFFAASDNHDGWMANPFTSNENRGVKSYSGLGAVWASHLERGEVWQAMYDRHTYGTTGYRPILEFRVEDGATVQEGTEYVASAPTFIWSYHGTAPIETITLEGVGFAEGGGVEVLLTETPGGLDREDGIFTWTDWDGKERGFWLKVEQTDGERAWSSPIFLTTDCESPTAEDPAHRCGGADSADTGPSTDDSDTGVDDPKGRCLGCQAAPASSAALAAALGALLGLRRRRRRARP